MSRKCSYKQTAAIGVLIKTNMYQNRYSLAFKQTSIKPKATVYPIFLLRDAMLAWLSLFSSFVLSFCTKRYDKIKKDNIRKDDIR